MIRIGPFAVVTTLLAGLLGPAPSAMADQQLPVPEIEKIVRDYLMREPQVIYEAIQELQKRQQEAEAARAQATIVERADEIFRHADDPVIGPASGDVTLVEFFDYHCGYCRAMVPKLQDLIKGDSQLRFVFKELPVLGPDSVTAAKASLAASKLDPTKYMGYHLALMQAKDIGLASVLKIAGEQGYDVDALRTAMDEDWIQERLDANQSLAQSLGINGTPSFVVGRTLIPGAVDVARLEELIAEQRKAVN